VAAHPYPRAILEQEFNKRFDVKQKFTRKNGRNSARSGMEIAGSSTHLDRDATMGLTLTARNGSGDERREKDGAITAGR